MIFVHTGTPGAGKSANVVQYYFVNAMLRGPWKGPSWRRAQVVTNFALRDEWAEVIAAALPMRSAARRQQMAADMRGRVLQFDDFGVLKEIGLACDKCGAEDEDCGHMRKEGRGLCLFDEASEPLNTRTWDTGTGSKTSKREAVMDRVSQIDFLKQHRKAGWNVHLVSQDLMMLDSQIRAMVDYEVMVRNLKHWKLLGFVPLGAMFGNVFTAITAWESGPRKTNGMRSTRMVHGRKMYRLKKVTKRAYDTHGKSHELKALPASIWLPRVTVGDFPPGLSAAKPASLGGSVPPTIEAVRPGLPPRDPEGL